MGEGPPGVVSQESAGDTGIRKQGALLGGSVGWSIVPCKKGLRFDARSGHILEATDGRFSLTHLPLSPPSISPSLPVSKSNTHILV